MALLEDMVDVMKGNVWTGLAVGLGAAVLVPVVLPAVARATKPVAKTAIKAGLVLFAKGRETVAELGEVAEDVYAEAKSELEHRREGAVEHHGESAPAEAQQGG
jgi:hypothetical protein